MQTIADFSQKKHENTYKEKSRPRGLGLYCYATLRNTKRKAVLAAWDCIATLRSVIQRKKPSSRLGIVLLRYAP